MGEGVNDFRHQPEHFLVKPPVLSSRYVFSGVCGLVLETRQALHPATTATALVQTLVIRGAGSGGIAALSGNAGMGCLVEPHQRAASIGSIFCDTGITNFIGELDTETFSILRLGNGALFVRPLPRLAAVSRTDTRQPGERAEMGT